MALLGFVVLLLGTFQVLTPAATALTAEPTEFAYHERSTKWWLAASLTVVIPVATFYPAFNWAAALVPASSWLPQSITNQIAFWAVLNGVIGVLIGRMLRASTTSTREQLWPSIIVAMQTVVVGYLVLLLVDGLFKVDFRFWFVGLKLLNLTQFQSALIYLIPLGIFSVLTSRTLHLTLSVKGDKPWVVYASNAFLLMGGFALLLVLQYGNLFINGQLLTPTEPLNTILMIQFVPILLTVSLVSTFAYRRTAKYLPGALINALFLAWYLTAGQATQYVTSAV